MMISLEKHIYHTCGCGPVAYTLQAAKMDDLAVLFGQMIKSPCAPCLSKMLRGEQ